MSEITIFIPGTPRTAFKEWLMGYASTWLAQPGPRMHLEVIHHVDDTIFLFADDQEQLPPDYQPPPGSCFADSTGGPDLSLLAHFIDVDRMEQQVTELMQQEVIELTARPDISLRAAALDLRRNELVHSLAESAAKHVPPGWLASLRLPPTLSDTTELRVEWSWSTITALVTTLWHAIKERAPQATIRDDENILLQAQPHTTPEEGQDRSRTKAKRPTTLDERIDRDPEEGARRKKAVEKYQALVGKGLTKEDAAKRVRHSRHTLETWLKHPKIGATPGDQPGQ